MKQGIDAKIIFGDSRNMIEVEDESVDLIVTSPPYWHIKDYGVPGQIGYGQTLHQYLRDLYCVFKECYRVLRPGSRLCINLGDQFARAIQYGRYKVIPLHAEVIIQCEDIGFDYMGAIIWQKKTTMNTTGGANIMGSFPYPPNGIVEIDYEFIMIFKKPGDSKRVSKEVKESSKLTKEEWKEYFSGHWTFGGAKQIGHEAMFPEELPRRLIKMFSFVGDVVLDPFLGSGTTVKVALELKRRAIGYEINKNYVNIIKDKLGFSEYKLLTALNIEIIDREEKDNMLLANHSSKYLYTPKIKNLSPLLKEINLNRDALFKVVKIVDKETIQLDSGMKVKFLGVNVINESLAMSYYKNLLLGKQVFLRFNDNKSTESDLVEAYVYLKNKLFVNAYLIKSGIGVPDLNATHKYKKKFIELWNRYGHGKGMDLKFSNKQMGA